MQSWPPKGLTCISTCSHSKSAEFLLMGVAALQFCFMSWLWLNLKPVTVSRSSSFLADQTGSPRMKDLASKNTLKDNKAGLWKDAINFRGYCGYRNSARREQWCSLGEEDNETQTATGLCSHSTAVPQCNDLCNRLQTINPRNRISLWPPEKLASSSLLLNQNLTTVGSKVNSSNDKTS